MMMYRSLNFETENDKFYPENCHYKSIKIIILHHIKAKVGEQYCFVKLGMLNSNLLVAKQYLTFNDL